MAIMQVGDKWRVTIDDHGFLEKIDNAQKRWPLRIEKVFVWTARLAQTKAKKRVSGPPTTKTAKKRTGEIVTRTLGFSGWVLRVRTGVLRSSISPFFRRNLGKIEAGLSANPFYAAIHELGLGKAKERSFLKPSIKEAIPAMLDRIKYWED